jgi:hypothetical protein
VLSFSYYKQKENITYQQECRKPDGCIKFIIYLGTKRKYTKKKKNRKGNVFLVLLIQNTVDFKRRPGTEAALKHDKMASLNGYSSSPSPLENITTLASW